MGIDWSQVYDEGYKFALIKATEGITYTSKYFPIDLKDAINAGIIVGAYHFALPVENGATEEARYFISAINQYLRNIHSKPVLALDLEDAYGEKPWQKLGWEGLSNWVHEWMNTVRQEVINEAGIEPILLIYVTRDYTKNLDDSVTKYALWIAHPKKNPTGSPSTGKWTKTGKDYVFWQYSWEGCVPGIYNNQGCVTDKKSM